MVTTDRTGPTNLAEVLRDRLGVELLPARAGWREERLEVSLGELLEALLDAYRIGAGQARPHGRNGR